MQLRQLQLRERIGVGKFAEVFKGIASDDSVYAVKKIDIFEMERKVSIEWQREIEILMKLSPHPNIVQLYDSFITAENELWIVFELCEKGDLSGLINSHKTHGTRIQETEIWNIIYQIAAGLNHLHRNSIFHRDVKPSNIFITSNGQIKLGDLGLGRILSSFSGEAHSLLGTPYYLSPELVNEQPYSFSADIWSLGCVAFELCQLQSPFHHNDPLVTFSSIQRCSFPPIDSSYSSFLYHFITQLLNINPDQRPKASDILSLIKNRSISRKEEFEYLGVIGRGKFSVVHKCRQRQTGRIVGVNIFDMNANSRREVINEIKLHHSLPKHQNIIEYIDLFVEDNELFLVLELAEYGDLQSLLKKRFSLNEVVITHSRIENGSKFTEIEVWQLFYQIAEGLRVMHSCRVMHRDIKPANIFLGADGSLKLGDFGLGRQFGSKTLETFSIVGTPFYMSPEVIHHFGYDFASDIWSLGCVLYELCAFHSPFFSASHSNYYTLGQAIKGCQYNPLPDYYSNNIKKVMRTKRAISSQKYSMPKISRIFLGHDFF